MYHLNSTEGWCSAVTLGIIQWSHYGNKCLEEKFCVLGGSRMSLGARKYSIIVNFCTLKTWERNEMLEGKSSGCSLMTWWPSKTSELFHLNCPSALPFLGGAVASKPLQKQLAAHLCELEPEGRSLAGLPGGKAEGRGSRAGSRTSHHTWRSAHIGTGAGECTNEHVK